MKAIVHTQYGSPDVLHLQEVDTPTPKKNEVLVRVLASSVNFGDITARNFKAIRPSEFSMPLPLWLPSRIMMGYRKPRNPILGSEFAGEVTAIGSEVTQFQIGDQVFGYRGMHMGTNAEYVCIAETGIIAPKPHNITHEEAVTLPYGALTALNLLRKVEIQPGQRVLVNGASGSIGSYAVQLAKHYGAVVTGVCSTPRIEYVKSLGADAVIDYTQEDFTKNGEQYDLIFDVLGKSSFARCKNSLTTNGRYLLASFKMHQVFQMIRTALFGKKKVICALSSENQADLNVVKQLVEEGAIHAIIDKRFPLTQVADAHRYIENGYRKGGLVIQVQGA